MKLDNGPVDLDDTIQPFARSKKQPYRDVMSQESPDSVELLDTEPKHDRPRRSERLNKTTWGPSKVTRAFMGSTENLLVLPSALQALPATKLKDDPWEHKINHSSLCEDHEHLRIYHAKLDLMGSFNV